MPLFFNFHQIYYNLNCKLVLLLFRYLYARSGLKYRADLGKNNVIPDAELATSSSYPESFIYHK